MATELSKEIAREILPILVYLAQTRQVITYNELAERTGRHPRNFNHPLGYIRDEICMPRGLPLLTALVVTRGTQLPGDGFLPAGRELLTDEEYEQEFIRFRDLVFAFKGWGELLRELGLQPLPLLEEDMAGLAAAHREVRARQEQSDEERAAVEVLERFVADNPMKLSIPTADPPVWDYEFASGERCDLLFEVAWPHKFYPLSVCYGRPGELAAAIERLERCRDLLVAERGEEIAEQIVPMVVAFTIPDDIREYAAACGVKCKDFPYVEGTELP